MEVEGKLREAPVTMTLDLLKQAKRFHATVSFIADTGRCFSLCLSVAPLWFPNTKDYHHHTLQTHTHTHTHILMMYYIGIKDALERVQKYNILLKEFPIQELLDAGTLTQLTSSLNNIFSHLNKKIKISPYPISRGLFKTHTHAHCL